MMPKTKNEGIFFTSLMCFLMVLGMSIYHLLLHQDFSMINLFMGLVFGFIVAFIFDVFVVGIVAKKIAFSCSFIDKTKPIQLILTISSLMVLGMVTFMSLFGLVVEGGFGALSVAAYLNAWKMNFIVALPYQLLIVGPFSRFVLKTIQNKKMNESINKSA